MTHAESVNTCSHMVVERLNFIPMPSTTKKMTTKKFIKGCTRRLNSDEKRDCARLRPARNAPISCDKPNPWASATKRKHQPRLQINIIPGMGRDQFRAGFTMYLDAIQVNPIKTPIPPTEVSKRVVMEVSRDSALLPPRLDTRVMAAKAATSCNNKTPTETRP